MTFDKQMSIILEEGSDVMSKTDPIRKKEDIESLKQYFRSSGHIRDYAMVAVALNTSLRISDLLQLKWGDVYDFNCQSFRAHINIVEKKTGKKNRILLNKECSTALELFRDSLAEINAEMYIYKSRIGQNRPIGRSTAYKIIKKAAEDLDIEGIIGCHSLRKTFGYQAWKTGVQPALIMSIYNHSSMEITKRYLSIDQDDKDEVFMKMNL